MYSTKSVGSKMEHWKTPALTGPSYRDFPTRTTWSRLLERKDKTRPNIWHGGRRLTGRQFLVAHLSSIFLNTKTTNATFQKSGKQDSFQHILNSSATLYKSSGSQFFRTTTELQSGPDAFDKTKLVMTFFNQLRSYRNILQFQNNSRGENW